jgi:WD40 repeat protein
MNEAKSCLLIHEAHSRSFYQIYQNQAENNQRSCYDLFLTNSIVDGVKLWDMRSARCVQQYNCHLNRSTQMKASISPDSNYISIGSEDKSAVVYDVRVNSSIYHKYGNSFSDNPSCVQFNPKSCQLIAATQDGKLYSYTAD